MKLRVHVPALLLTAGVSFALPSLAKAGMSAAAATLPAPEFTQVYVTPSLIVIGQALNITVTVGNAGGPSPDGRISISFPALDLPIDFQRVASSSSGDLPGFSKHRAGTALADSACQPMTAAYLMAEYGDNDWTNTEGNTFSVAVAPRDTGVFTFYVRATLEVPDAPCQWVNALPADGEAGYTDQQGWTVKRFSIRVASTPRPAPAFTSLICPDTISLGQTLSISASVTDGSGGPSSDGRISIGLPGFISPSDDQWVTGGGGGDSPGYVERPAGSTLVAMAGCQPVIATYLVVEAIDDAWATQEINSIAVFIQPQSAGIIYFDVRATLNWSGLGPCEPITAVPASGLGLPVPPGGVYAIDQQGFSVMRYAVTVLPRPPAPRFIAPVEGIPATMTLGGQFTLTMAVGNDGSASNDGRVTVSFPAFTHAGDEAWVTSDASGDVPGYIERPPGSALVRANCQTMTAGYLAAEYADSSWEGSASETNTVGVTVQPQAAGTFFVDIRATMHDPGAPGCAYVNTIPDGSGPAVTDQQGWTVRRFEVSVLPAGPAGSPTTTWSLVTPPPGGPSGRYSSSAVFHPGRDALVLYGGSDGHYRTDVWSLPLAPGSPWTQLLPGGPTPRQRIMASMIHNPVEDHLVVFGGLYDFPINDLTALALSPLVWWFPATPVGPQPTPRYGQAAVYDPPRHRMLVIGGFDGSVLNDVWEYRLPGDGSWTRLSPAGTPMPGRTQHTAVYDARRDRVIVFGGDGGTFLNDVWELTLGDAPAWNQLTPAGTPPSGRREHSMIYDSDLDRLVIFAGYGGTRMNDVWALWLDGAPRWEQLYSSTNSPSPRAQPAAVYDPVRHRMVVFGGQVGTNAYSSELWSLSADLPTPTLVSLVSAEATRDRVRLSWTAGGPGAIAPEVRRSAARSGPWDVLGPAVREGDELVFEDREVVPGARYLYRLVAGGAATVLDEVWVTVPALSQLALLGASPNPVAGPLTVTFSLPGTGRALLELYDLKGRQVASRDVGGLGAGEHSVTVANGRDMPAGVYLIRLVRGERTLTAKACVVR